MTHDNTGHIFHTTVKTLNGRLWRIPTLPTVPPPTVWSPWPSSRSSWSSENKCVKQTTARRHQNCVQKVHFHSSFWLSLKMFKACWQSLKKIKNLSVKFKAQSSFIRYRWVVMFLSPLFHLHFEVSSEKFDRKLCEEEKASNLWTSSNIENTSSMTHQLFQLQLRLVFCWKDEKLQRIKAPSTQRTCCCRCRFVWSEQRRAPVEHDWPPCVTMRNSGVTPSPLLKISR